MDMDSEFNREWIEKFIRRNNFSNRKTDFVIIIEL